MENHNDIKPKDRQHDIKLVNDKIAVIGELEHMRRHAIRSYAAMKNKAKDEMKAESRNWMEEKAIYYLLTATMATKRRRDYMERHFSNLSDEDWCLTKSAATLRQLIYETEGTGEDIELTDRFIDETIGCALGMDLTGCRDCNEDRKGE